VGTRVAGITQQHLKEIIRRAQDKADDLSAGFAFTFKHELCKKAGYVDRRSQKPIIFSERRIY
jgi:hypothetical protein